MYTDLRPPGVRRQSLPWRHRLPGTKGTRIQCHPDLSDALILRELIVIVHEDLEGAVLEVGGWYLEDELFLEFGVLGLLVDPTLKLVPGHRKKTQPTKRIGGAAEVPRDEIPGLDQTNRQQGLVRVVRDWEVDGPEMLLLDARKVERSEAVGRLDKWNETYQYNTIWTSEAHSSSGSIVVTYEFGSIYEILGNWHFAFAPIYFGWGRPSWVFPGLRCDAISLNIPFILWVIGRLAINNGSTKLVSLPSQNRFSSFSPKLPGIFRKNIR